MLHRFASQYVFCSPTQILSRTVVEQNDNNIITRIFSLNEGNVESARTLFFDGIISFGIVSVKFNLPLVDISQIADNYNYIDITTLQPNQKIITSNKPLLLDFRSESVEDVNLYLSRLATTFIDFSVFDIIAACTHYPSLFLNLPSKLEVNNCCNIQLWEGIDLFNKKMTNQTRIRQF